MHNYTVLQLDESDKAEKSLFEALKGQDETVLFQKKDTVGNILYSWKFKGTDITDPMELDMGLTSDAEQPAALAKLTGSSRALYLKFAHEGDLPGKATVSVRVSDTFSSGQTLYFYHYDTGRQALTLQASGVKVENGYASFTITHCSDYVLSAVPLTGASSLAGWIALAVVLALCALEAALMLADARRRKQGQPGLRKAALFARVPLLRRLVLPLPAKTKTESTPQPAAPQDDGRLF